MARKLCRLPGASWRWGGPGRISCSLDPQFPSVGGLTLSQDPLGVYKGPPLVSGPLNWVGLPQSGQWSCQKRFLGPGGHWLVTQIVCVYVYWGQVRFSLLGFPGLGLRCHWDQNLVDQEVPCDFCDSQPSLFLMLAVAACAVVRLGGCALQYESSVTWSFPIPLFWSLLLEYMGTVFGAPLAKGLLTLRWGKA